MKPRTSTQNILSRLIQELEGNMPKTRNIERLLKKLELENLPDGDKFRLMFAAIKNPTCSLV